MIARYYFHECERFLRYAATPRHRREAEGVPRAPYDRSPVTHAILDSGYAWEEEIIGRHLARLVDVAPAADDRPIRDRVHGVDSSRRLLSNLRPGHYIYQPTLRTPPSFYVRYGVDPGVVMVSDCRPDLISCFEDTEGYLQLRVIDVKASPGLKLSHRIQATLYTLVLEHALVDWGVDDRNASYEPGIWLARTDRPETFDVRAMRPPLEDFLQRDLQPLMEKPADKAPWHVYFRCEWCEWFQHCQEEMRRDNDVSRIPYLSSHAKRFLGELEPPVRSLEQLDSLVRGPDAARLDDCASLSRAQARIGAQVRSLLEERTETYGSASLAMPKAEHVRLVVTLQAEPVSGQVYAWGVLAQGLREVFEEVIEPMVEVAATEHAAEIQRVERAVVQQLYWLLKGVHDYNLEHDGDWRAQKTVQVYVYDTYERDLLIDLLVRRLLDPVVADAALALFFHFQEPELLEADNQPATEVFFPVAVLVQVLRKLMALPVEVVYRFAETVRLLQPSQYPFEYRETGFFAFQLSNEMRSDAIFQVWHRGRSDLIEAINRDVRARLRAANSLVNGVREAVAGSGALFAWPPKFRFPDALGYRHIVLSRLAFIARYESALGYLAVREARTGPLAERLRSGAAIRLRHAGGDRFDVDPIHEDLDIQASGFHSWMLTEYSEHGHRAALLYHDYANRERMWVPRDLAVGLAAISSVESSDEHPNQALHLEIRGGAATPIPEPGRVYLLQPRFTDFNTSRCLAELRELDQEVEPGFTGILEDPRHSLGGSTLAPAVWRRALELAERVGMTSSQQDAMAKLIQNKLLVVWGPPGTGKTHFLALAVQCLAASQAEVGQPFRVLVSAFTHAAIDNCLRQLADVGRRNSLVPGGLRVAKLGQIHLPDMEGVEQVAEGTAGDWLHSGEIAVAGGTAWAIRKDVDPATMDLLVLDEGSQLKVPEAAIPIRRLRAGGALVVAGDDRQLPPIVQGDYPEPADGATLLHRSIFECLRAPKGSDEWTAMLLENFRMNRTLCRYPAEQVYVPEYRSATEEIAGRQLKLAPAVESGGLADTLLDPAYPLAVGIIEGVRATAENRVEANLVATAACQLRERLLGVKDDADFWRHGLFIVSPHHAQIHAIRRALRSCRVWGAEPFVDTVDKMQGQECDAVIASYGVSDVEYAMQEAAFIYSLNRLNVSLTRARAKTIVFLPRPLIEPPIQAYEDEAIAAGVAFMQGLVRFAERHCEATLHELPGSSGQLELLRVPQLAD